VSDISTESDPKAATSYRLALAAVIALGALIVIGLLTIVVGLTLGWNKPSALPAAPIPKPVSMTLAPGFTILSSDTQPGRLILHVRSTTMDEIDIIDLSDGHIVSQIHAPAPK
jgi:hypothetical protein